MKILIKGMKKSHYMKFPLVSNEKSEKSEEMNNLLKELFKTIKIY